MAFQSNKVLAACLAASIVAFGSLLSTSGCGASSQNAQNVVLIIGDGMGEAQRSAIRLANVGLEGSLAMDNLAYSGSIRTSPADADTVVTDSAAGGTAIATGVKTDNGTVGVGPGGKPVTTILEEAGQAGKATGLITTDQVTGATPAAFAAHVTDRENQREIARQYLGESTPDIILGGGKDIWSSENLIKRAKESGYEYVSDEGELKAAEGPKILGLFADARMFLPAPEGEGAAYNPAVPLDLMTQKTLDTLSEDPDGFFLMVEEEAIDEMGHSNNAHLMIKAGRQLDKTVSVVRSFAERNPGTLVIVTADHETGGLSIEEVDESDYYSEPDSGNSSEDGPFRVNGSEHKIMLDWTTTNHTGEAVPLTAMGPGAERLVGVHENTYVHEMMKKALSL